MTHYISITDTSDPKLTFWERQFSSSVTTPQIVFDVILGMLLPVLCFWFDPGLLRGGLGFLVDLPIPDVALFTYGLSTIAIPTLALWLLFGRRAKVWSGLIAGPLLSAALCSFAIGILLFPLSFLALIVVIGVLGFIPLFTAFVYFRNAVRAINHGRVYSTGTRVAASLLLSFALTIAIPLVANWKISQIASESVDQILQLDSPSIENAVQRAKYFKWHVDLDRLVLAYERESDPVHRERLARAYEEITGKGIEARLAVLRD